MKVAIFHNYLDNIGGAEVVTLTMARELGADIYTTNIDKEKIKDMGFPTDNIFSIGKIPLNPPFRQEFAYWKFRNLDLGQKYDFYIISGDWAMSGARRNRPNLWYVHSPTREIWDLYEYTRKNIVKKIWQKPLFDLWVFIRRIINRNDVNYAQKIASSSINVQGRLKKYLGKESIIINPPTEIKNFHYNKNGDFWLSVNRLLGTKRVEMQINAFSRLPDEKLVIIGPYEKAGHFQTYAEHCRKICPKNVHIISQISHEGLLEYYANCKAFVTTAKDEDYGMTPVEAMASGKPVIAPNEGGYKETVINGITGFLIDSINEEKLAKAIQSLGIEINEKRLKFKESCQQQAKNFDTGIFMKKIREQIAMAADPSTGSPNP